MWSWGMAHGLFPLHDLLTAKVGGYGLEAEPLGSLPSKHTQPVQWQQQLESERRATELELLSTGFECVALF